MRSSLEANGCLDLLNTTANPVLPSVKAGKITYAYDSRPTFKPFFSPAKDSKSADMEVN